MCEKLSCYAGEPSFWEKVTSSAMEGWKEKNKQHAHVLDHRVFFKPAAETLNVCELDALLLSVHLWSFCSSPLKCKVGKMG